MSSVPKPDSFAANVNAIYLEKVRAAHRWGDPAGRRISLTTWQAVLTEEVGEVAKAILRGPIDGREAIRDELVQTAAVCVAMLEALDNAPWGFDEDKAG